MQNKLILSLWVIGGLLYAGSTIFLANTLLGGGSSGGKPTSLMLATAQDPACAKNDVAVNAGDPVKTAALEPKTAAAPPKPAAPSAKPESAQAPQTETPNEADTSQDGQFSDEAPDAADGRAELPDEDAAQAPWNQDQAGMQPEGPAEQDEWAHVIAGTADMRAEPSLQSQLIYALPSGWQVRVISREPGWVQVQDANSGASGWVEASAIAPGAGPHAAQGYGRYQRGPYGGPYPRYADEGYPYPPPWQRRRGEFADFLRRALGGF